MPSAAAAAAWDPPAPAQPEQFWCAFFEPTYLISLRFALPLLSSCNSLVGGTATSSCSLSFKTRLSQHIEKKSNYSIHSPSNCSLAAQSHRRVPAFISCGDWIWPDYPYVNARSSCFYLHSILLLQSFLIIGLITASSFFSSSAHLLKNLQVNVVCLLANLQETMLDYFSIWQESPSSSVNVS